MADRAGGCRISFEDLITGWDRVGLEEGMVLIVHSSLSSIGSVDGGAAMVVESLRAAVGRSGTLVAPTFTPQVADPVPDVSGVPDSDLIGRRSETPVFHRELPSEMGAISESLRKLPCSLRSSHPQVSVAAIGGEAAFIAGGNHPLGFAVGRGSPFERMYEVGGYILLIGVGHNRNTFLHHAESLTHRPRLKLRRFPKECDGERVWIETLDVADDNDRLFPTVGREFEKEYNVRSVIVGNAECRLVHIRPFVSFAVKRLEQYLAEEPSDRP